MSGLDAAVRAKLAGFSNGACLGGCGCEDNRCDVYGFDEMRDALIAVLGQHEPIGLHHDLGETSRVCADCRFFAPAWPCPTVRLIAKALGVEVDGG
jgi:hypothetical protein